VERYHIGKSSAGWVFVLHEIDEYDWPPAHDDYSGLARPVDWPTWLALLSESWVTIRDEYGDEISLDDMIKLVTGRARRDGGSTSDMGSDSRWDPAVGLWRTGRDSRRERAVAGQTYDIASGEFS
jgi:hypothetical protein